MKKLSWLKEEYLNLSGMFYNMRRPIAISLSPNTEKDDVLLALSTLLSISSWQDENEVTKLEREFAQMFGPEYRSFAFNSGRSAEYVILRALGVGPGDEVVIQSFTCVAVPNSILWLGAKPVYADIDDSYNMDPKDLESKITSRTKVIILQHTFGIPAKIDKIKKIAEKHNIYLIEDCAHALGAEYKGDKVGTFGDVSFFSFGRDKILSSVFGGIALTRDRKLAFRIGQVSNNMAGSKTGWVLQQLFHPVAMSLILPLYNLKIGRILLFLFQELGLLSRAVYSYEKNCLRPPLFPAKLPGGLAHLARHQLNKLGKYNNHRKQIAKFYFRELGNTAFSLPSATTGSVWLRFPMRHEKAHELFKFAKKKKILLGDWYRDVITPVSNLSLAGYQRGSCPKAEWFSKTVINLPTYPTLSKTDAQLVVRVVKQWLGTL